jgi:hypothetical protein
MSYPLKNKFSNKQNVDLKNLNDTLLDENFAKSLETLINGWVQNPKYKITLNNVSNNKFVVQYTVDTGSGLGDNLLQDYINSVINPILSGNQLNIDIRNKKITFTQKQESIGGNTTTVSSDSSDDSIDSIAQKLTDSGVFNNPMVSQIAMNKPNVFEEIFRIKKLLKI